LGNFLKKVPQAPQKLSEKIGKNSHIVFLKWVNRLHLSLFWKFLKFLETFFKKFLSGVQGQSPCPINQNLQQSISRRKQPRQIMPWLFFIRKYSLLLIVMQHYKGSAVISDFTNSLQTRIND